MQRALEEKTLLLSEVGRARREVGELRREALEAAVVLQLARRAGGSSIGAYAASNGGPGRSALLGCLKGGLGAGVVKLRDAVCITGAQ
jgi:hypothetical protein